MKKQYYFLILLCSLFLFNCKPEIKIPFIPKNHLAEFQTEKSQIFNLDTIYSKEIIGEHGTKFFYHRELFDLKENEKVQLELIELYNFKEILYRNIQTVTTDNQLLETSGVLKIKFTSNGKELQLKKGEKLMIYPPKGKLKENDIFLSETDSIGNVKWKITDQDYTTFEKYVGGGITVLITIPLDSLNHYIQKEKEYKKLLEKRRLVRNKLIKESNFFILKNVNSEWINIDRITSSTSKINFELYEGKKEFSGFNIYITYRDLNSFLYYSMVNDGLFFYDIPIKGKVYITIIGKNKNGMFYDQIELNNLSNDSKVKLNMKKISEENLKELFNK